jgi:hypothetical protein
MAKKNKIPKKVAGFKVPKSVRKSPVVAGLLGSETGRKILGDALMAGAAAAAAILIKKNDDEIVDAGEKVAKKTQKAGGLAKEVVKEVSSAMIGVIGNAARAVVPGHDDDAKSVSEPAPLAQKRIARQVRSGKARPAHH